MVSGVALSNIPEMEIDRESHSWEMACYERQNEKEENMFTHKQEW